MRRNIKGPRHIDRIKPRIWFVSSGNLRHTSGRDKSSSTFALSSVQNQLSSPGFSVSATAESRACEAKSIDRYIRRTRNFAAGRALVGNDDISSQRSPRSGAHYSGRPPHSKLHGSVIGLASHRPCIRRALRGISHRTAPRVRQCPRICGSSRLAIRPVGKADLRAVGPGRVRGSCRPRPTAQHCRVRTAELTSEGSQPVPRKAPRPSRQSTMMAEGVRRTHKHYQRLMIALAA